MLSGWRFLIFKVLHSHFVIPEKSINKMSWLMDELQLARGERENPGFLTETKKLDQPHGRADAFISSLLLAQPKSSPPAVQLIVPTESNWNQCLSFLWLYPRRQGVRRASCSPGFHDRPVALLGSSSAPILPLHCFHWCYDHSQTDKIRLFWVRLFFLSLAHDRVPEITFIFHPLITNLNHTIKRSLAV